MRSGAEAAEVSPIDQTPKLEAANGPCVASMTSLNLLDWDPTGFVVATGDDNVL
jgi:hypothetical protein